MNGYVCWVEYYNEIKAKTETEVIALTCRSYTEAAKYIEDLYSNDLVSMKMLALEDGVIHINEEIAQSIIKGDFI